MGNISWSLMALPRRHARRDWPADCRAFVSPRERDDILRAVFRGEWDYAN